MGENISIAPAFRTKSPHRGVILFRTVEDAGPYNGANDNLKQLDKPEFIDMLRTTTAPVIPTKPQARGGISQLEKLRIFREIPRLPLVARDDMRFR